MIRNERQYRVTKAQLRNLEKALKETEGRTTTLPKRLEEAMYRGLRSQIDELKKEMQEYENRSRNMRLKITGL